MQDLFSSPGLIVMTTSCLFFGCFIGILGYRGGRSGMANLPSVGAIP